MKHTKTLAILFAAILVATVFCGNYSFADFDVKKIQEIQGTFVNGGNEFFFTYEENPQGDILTSAEGKEDVDITAYSLPLGRSGYDASQQAFFRTFCIEPDAPVEGTLVGTLNYEMKGTEWVTQTSEDNELTLGAAILYKEFAVDGRSADSLRQAILVLMGMDTINSWSDNVHLQYLYEKNQFTDVWTANYDPAQYHELVGDYCVFVLDVVSATDRSNRQDFLYIAKVNTSTDVPEPASLLFWTLGGLGAAGTSWARKRRMKKLSA